MPANHATIKISEQFSSSKDDDNTTNRGTQEEEENTLPFNRKEKENSSGCLVNEIFWGVCLTVNVQKQVKQHRRKNILIFNMGIK